MRVERYWNKRKTGGNRKKEKKIKKHSLVSNWSNCLS
jgi:hypothetical protein